MLSTECSEQEIASAKTRDRYAIDSDGYAYVYQPSSIMTDLKTTLRQIVADVKDEDRVDMRDSVDAQHIERARAILARTKA